jgi:hypothetical protein
MSDLVLQRDVAALGSLLRLSAASPATAGGTGDATLVAGTTFDRMSSSNGSLATVMNAGVAYDAVLSASATLSISYAIQDSDDGITFSDYRTGAASVVATGPAGGGAVNGVFDIGSINLSSARRYIRLNYTPDLSAANTDTAALRAIGFAAGFDRLPG